MDAGHYRPDGMPALTEWDVDKAVTMIDDLGVRTVMLSVSSPGVHFRNDPAETPCPRRQRGGRGGRERLPRIRVARRSAATGCPGPWLKRSTPSTFSGLTGSSCRPTAGAFIWATAGSIPFSPSSIAGALGHAPDLADGPLLPDLIAGQSMPTVE